MGYLTPVTTVERTPDQEDPWLYVRSFLIMRVAIGVLGLLLPLTLILEDWLLFGSSPVPRSSLSAYYYSGVRELFVGTLCATGVFLMAYKAAEKSLDNTLSVIAGFAAIVVALFPTGMPEHVKVPMPLQDLLSEEGGGGAPFLRDGRVHRLARRDHLLLRRARGQAGPGAGQVLA